MQTPGYWALALLIMSLAALGASAAREGKREVVIFRKEGVYGCFPMLFADPRDGAWVVTFGTRVRASHIDSTGGSAQYLSRDGGLTWAEATPRRAPALALPGGRLLWAEGKGWERFPEARKDELLAQGLEVRPVSEGVVAVARGAYVRWSDDGGASWQSKEIATPPGVRCLMGFHGGIVLSEGTVLVPIYGTLGPEEPYRAWVMRSADRGETWEWAALARDPEGKVGYDEASLVQLRDGRVIAHVRTEKGDGCLAQCESQDGGKTWSPPRSTGLWGHPPHLLLLADGSLLCTYGYRQEPFGVRAALSTDGGKTWLPQAGAVLRDDGAGWDLGYPMSLQAADGTILTTYYFTDRDKVTHIAASRYPPEWLAAHAAASKP